MSIGPSFRSFSAIVSNRLDEFGANAQRAIPAASHNLKNSSRVAWPPRPSEAGTRTARLGTIDVISDGRRASAGGASAKEILSVLLARSGVNVSGRSRG